MYLKILREENIKTPVLFIGFNRPKLSAFVYERIAEAKPCRLYVAIDGPRRSVQGEEQKVKEVCALFEEAKWPCQIKYLLSKSNQGCKRNVSSAIIWFFQHEERGIILEDDCLPHLNFFSFCEQKLEKYKKNEKIWTISGNNFQGGRIRGDCDHYYSIYNHNWGWATWRDRWARYDSRMSFWPQWKKTKKFVKAYGSEEESKYWATLFDQTYGGKIDTWDYQWTALIRMEGGLNVIPQVNLVTNIGFGEEATHTKNQGTGLSIPSQSLALNCRTPEVLQADEAADRYVFENIFCVKKGATSLENQHVHLSQKRMSFNCPNAESAKLQLFLLRCLIATPFYQKAFLPLARMKAAGKKWKGIDYLRGIIRLKSGFPMEAAEMLKEELRLHPGHSKARRLLNTIMTDTPIDRSNKHDELGYLIAKLRPYTMLSPDRLLALYKGAKNICEKDIPGNFVECGVAAGGSSALLAWVIKRYSRRSRLLYSFDTFTGMPKPGVYDTHAGMDAQSTGWGEGTCAASIESVLEIAGKLNVESFVNPVQGLFQDTLPKTRHKIGPVALLHLDGDWYDSTRTILENLYSQVEIGAYLQVDDYGHWEGCRRAFDEFFKKNQHQPKTKPIDATGVWFEKSA